MKKIVSISACILFFCNDASAGGTCGTNCTWNIDGDVLTISGTGTMTSSAWKNDPDKDLIKSVVIEEGITSVGYTAFQNMSNVTSLSIPGSVTSIDVLAFSGMSNVTSLVIPSSVASIGSFAFQNMSSVTGELKIPNGVTSIGGYAFSGMSNVTSLVIPDGVTSIGYRAFFNMSSVTGELKIPDGVTYIGTDAFYGMSNVTGELKIPNGVTSIGAQTFLGMSNVTSVVIPDSVTSIGEKAFMSMNSVTSLVIPDSVTEIGGYAFYNMKVSNITCSEENLRRYIEAIGGLKSDTEIVCTSGDCENALKGTKYANLIGNVVYPRKEVGQSDGSVAIYKKGKIVGFKKKRIYTVDEAEFLSKPTGNKFKVRYK